MRVSYHAGHACESGYFDGRALGIAAGNYYLAGGVFAADAADGGAGVLLGGGGDGTGV
jgi:hypothetical protein